VDKGEDEKEEEDDEDDEEEGDEAAPETSGDDDVVVVEDVDAESVAAAKSDKASSEWRVIVFGRLLGC